MADPIVFIGNNGATTEFRPILQYAINRNYRDSYRNYLPIW